jgi:hypothetical protein
MVKGIIDGLMIIRMVEEGAWLWPVSLWRNA